ncbi:MAG: arsenical pump-driving ATPase, partial [Desulfosarcina sp.]|nr:arsenical pump-driving ATPase [Desulfosarcina sp.]
MAGMPEKLKALPTTRVPFRPAGVMRVAALQSVYRGQADRSDPETAVCPQAELVALSRRIAAWPDLLRELEAEGKGVIMTMGKGGVGKTTVATAIALELSRRGHTVHLSTTD